VTTSVEAEASYFGVGVKTSVSASVSTNYKTQASSIITQSTATRKTFTCTLGKKAFQVAMYQFKITAVESGSSAEVAIFKTDDIWCSDDNDEPQCPPGFCNNKRCNKCKDGWKRS